MAIQAPQPQFDSLPIWLRIWHLTGDQKKGIDPLLPFGRAALYERIKDGRFPAPDHRFGERIAVWHRDQIRPFVVFAECDGVADHQNDAGTARPADTGTAAPGPHTPKVAQKNRSEGETR